MATPFEEFDLFFKWKYTRPQNFDLTLLNEITFDIFVRFGRVTTLWVLTVLIVIGIQYPALIIAFLLCLCVVTYGIFMELELKQLIATFCAFVITSLVVFRQLQLPFLIFCCSSYLPLVVISVYRDRSQFNESAEKNIISGSTRQTNAHATEV